VPENENHEVHEIGNRIDALTTRLNAALAAAVVLAFGTVGVALHLGTRIGAVESETAGFKDDIARLERVDDRRTNYGERISTIEATLPLMQRSLDRIEAAVTAWPRDRASAESVIEKREDRLPH